MPSSHYFQLDQLTELIVKTNPFRLLDVGIGFGKYGLLAREYLELWDGRFQYDDWRRRIDGIEIHRAFIRDWHRAIYDQIWIGDALEILPTLPSYDLVLLIDVLEHFPEQSGHALLAEAVARNRNVLV